MNLVVLMLVSAALVFALPSIKVNNEGNMIIDTDGGELQVQGGVGPARNVLAAPRQFGARFTLARTKLPTIQSSYGYGGAQIDRIARDDSAAKLCVMGGRFAALDETLTVGFFCGMAITYSDNSASFSKPPICTFQPISAGTGVTGVGVSIATNVVSLNATTIRICTGSLGTLHQDNGSPLTVWNCDHGDGLVISCVA